MSMMGYKPLFAAAPDSIAPQMGALPMNGAFAPVGKVKQPFDWHRAAGIFGDVLAGLNGQQGSYAPMLQKQQADQTAFERGEQQYQRRRADENTDWQTRQAWEAAHPKPAQPTEYERLLTARGLVPGTAAYNAALDAKLYPPIPVQGFDAAGNPTITMVPRGGAPMAAPAAPVGKLRPIGGAAPQGAGSFQPPRFGR